MALNWNVSIRITPSLHGCISKPIAGDYSRVASFSSGAYRKQNEPIPILQRGCAGMGTEHTEFENSGRLSSRNWKGWAGPIPITTADLLAGCSVGNGQVSAVEEEEGVMEGDVVEYPVAVGAAVGQQEGMDNGRLKGVGVIVDMIRDSDGVLCQIEPLCQENPGSNQWIHDESKPEITVPMGQVRVLQAWYSQRMVPDRISNPHGEHAENIWILE